MKRLALLLLGLCFLATPTLADNIGVIDMEKVFVEAKMVKNFEKNIQEKRESYQKLFKKEQEKLEKARKKGQSEEDIEKLITKIEETLRPKQQEIAQLEGSFQQTLLFTINSTAKEVAKEYGIDVVMDKRAVFHGGFDLTDFVISKINTQD